MNSSRTNSSELGLRPAANELEVSLFGPGVGECVVAHLGAGEWAIVDSCINSETRSPVALEYLDALGVDVATGVKQVIVTHWHDDHIRGSSEVLAKAVNAKFVCSAALRRDEFKQAVAAAQRLNVKARDSSGVREFGAILTQLKERRANGAGAAQAGPEWARADQLLFRRVSAASVPGCEMFALSPSAATLSRGLGEIAVLLPQIGHPKRAAVALDANETCLVLSIQMGDAVALLGSDLENTESTDRGWAAVLSTTARPFTPARVFKVPHHGSLNAHHPDVWQDMLSKSPTCIVTPYSRSKLPREEDIGRMQVHAQQLFSTSPLARRAKLKDAAVQRTVNEVAKEFFPRVGRMGHVRVRLGANDTEPRVELFGAAFRH